jgi:hypothetical protein
MPEQNNPALRLLDILQRARTQQSQFLIGWANVFELQARSDTISPEIEIAAAQHLVQLWKLVDEIEEKVRASGEEDLEDYLEPFSRIRDGIRFMRSTGGRLSETLNHITPSDLTVLRFCAKLIARDYPEPDIKQELDELLDDVNSLYKDIEESDLPAELKTLLLDLLHTLRTAIHEYKVRGIERIREAIATMLGTLIIHKSEVQQASKTSVGASVLRVFWKAVSLVHYAPEVTKIIETVAPVAKLLLGHAPGPDDVPPPPIS